ncbi:MAG: ATP-grasp domain-containing protein [Myxococcota bacterium]
MSQTSSPCVVIVEAVSTAAMFSPRLKEQGFETVHVSTDRPFAEGLANTYRAGDHVANIVFNGDMDACVAEVAKHRPLAVIPGHDPGVELADALAERLGLPNNGTTLSVARNKKFPMQEVLRNAGVRHMQSYSVESWTQLAALFPEKLQLPVVIKPNASAASDMVTLCRTMEELETTFGQIYGQENKLGVVNDCAIVQPFFDGIEYCVNTASCAGRHVFTDLWRIDKVVGNSFVDDRAEILPVDESTRHLREYSEAVLDAMGIKFGAGYLSIIVDEQGPVLIEMAARTVGQNPTLMTEATLGISQLAATLDAYINPTRFFERGRSPYVMSKRGSLISLISPRAGTIEALPRWEEMSTLESFFSGHTGMKPGVHIEKTENLHTSPGYVNLVHEDPEVVERDYATIRRWERDDFYVFA